MPRRRSFSGREVCRILTGNGFAEVRQRGSHIVMQKKILQE
ncbi:MAG: type II toxin-antitoxin system HicA family toxin [Chloroflexota bacterium]|nr:type II toxin-antitoxin system HicA family toxin [Chloroflexota bacterium]